MPTLVTTQDPSTGYVSTGTPQPTDVQGWVLRTREAALSAQLAVLTQRRDALSQQARASTGVARTAIETQLSQVNRLIAQAQADLEAARSGAFRPVHYAYEPAVVTAPALPRRNNDVAMMGIAASTILLLPFVLLIVRRLWRRGAKPPVAQEWSGAPDRLRRLEQAVDTIAIEVERISESQRFTTRLLAESAAALGNAVASPLAVPVGAPVATGDPRRK